MNLSFAGLTQFTMSSCCKLPCLPAGSLYVGKVCPGDGGAPLVTEDGPGGVQVRRASMAAASRRRAMCTATAAAASSAQKGPAAGPQPQPKPIHLSETAGPALQVGIASMDSDPGFWPTCDFNTTAAYTDVRALRGWIDATVEALEA